MKWFSSTQFAIYRIVLGLYLTIHFIELLPNGKELFSNQGMINNAKTLPSYGKLPVIIFYFDDPNFISIFIFTQIITSILFTYGICRRICSIYLYYCWMCLLNRNPLITNPSLGYIGWILLACSIIPKNERLGFMLTKDELEKEKKKNKIWQVPDIIYYGMWIIIGISYTASGIHKLQCPSWLNGTSLWYVLTSPLARDNFIVKILSSDMLYIKFMSWGSLFLEISALFLGTFYRTRKSYWIMFMGFHFGILFTVNFSDLTWGMIMVHLFTFDSSWFEFTKNFIIKYDYYGIPPLERDVNHTDGFNSKKMKEHASNIISNISKSFDYTRIEFNNKNDNKKSNNLISWCIWAIFFMIIGFLISANNGFIESYKRFEQITLDMYWGFGIISISMGIFMLLERLFPDQELKHVDGWWKWVIIINIFQLFAVVLATFTWEEYLQNTSYFKSNGFHLRDHVTPFTGGLIAYLINTWLFYHWHKARHLVYLFWILFHQFHHSPSRIETATSFYKHFLEIIADSQIMAILLYSILGLSKESSIWLSVFSAFGEYFYHMNIKTPKWIGYIFQRPESHRCHHRKMKRIQCPNYSDFPLWDILGGTFENPKEMNDSTGFFEGAEQSRLDMLLFKDVIFSGYQNITDFKKLKQVVIRYTMYFLVLFGTLNSLTFITHNESMREIGFISASSPLPLVFSNYNNVETFSTNFTINLTFTNGTICNFDLNSKIYNRMNGSYNRRNVYGAMFSHGPFFNKENMIKIGENILNYAICNPGTIISEFGFIGKVDKLHVDVFNRSGNNTHIGFLDVVCLKS